MATKRPSLGRGLEALLGGSKAASPEAIDSEAPSTPPGEELYPSVADGVDGQAFRNGPIVISESSTEAPIAPWSSSNVAAVWRVA